MKLQYNLKRFIRIFYCIFNNWQHSHEEYGEDGLLIYDVGLHVGQDTDYYLKKGFRVIAIEANPELATAAANRFSSAVSDARLTVVNCGISTQNETKPINFFINEEVSEWSSFDESLARRGGHRCRVVETESRTLASVIKQFGLPFYVKIDIEGQDSTALLSILDSGYRPRYISVENGNQGMLSLLAKSGYDKFKYIQQNSVDKQRCPYPPRHGRYYQYPFPRGASGQFGEEAPGNWMTEIEVRREISKVWDPDGEAKNPLHDDRTNGWFDLHSKYSDLDPDGAT